jgi:hypothetical protein
VPIAGRRRFVTAKPEVDQRAVAKTTGVVANQRLDLLRLPGEIVDLAGGDLLQVLITRECPAPQE